MSHPLRVTLKSMTKRTSNLRIKGLVRLMNHVRDQLRAGIPPEQAEDFRAMVRDNIQTVDRICRENRTTPADLPAPSRRAYAYLRSLDLKHLPKPDETTAGPPPSKKIRISGIVATCNHYHRRFEKAVATKKRPFRSDDARIQSLVEEIRTETDAIAGICEDAGSTPGALPMPSQHGYQWLRFLSTPEHLVQHLNALRAAHAIARRLGPKADVIDDTTILNIQFYATSMLYRAKAKGHNLHILIHEGFIGAAPSVLEALMRSALSAGSDADQVKMKAFTLDDDFVEIQMALEAATADLRDQPQGQYHDLGAAFERVNATYFEGAIARPTLVWNRTPTVRKMGHYDKARDILMVSISLDHPKVPDYVIDYIVYHEVLHKQMGVDLVNGRRQAHTPDFRQAEQAFARYEEAKVFLSRMPGNLC